MVRYATAGCIQPNPNHGRIGRPTFCLPYPTTAPSGGGKDARWSMSVDLSAPPVRLANKLLVALLRAENETFLAAFWPQCLFVRSAGLRDLAQAGCMPALLQGATAMRRVAFQMPSHWFWSDGGKRTKHRNNIPLPEQRSLVAWPSHLNAKWARTMDGACPWSSQLSFSRWVESRADQAWSATDKCRRSLSFGLGCGKHWHLGANGHV